MKSQSTVLVIAIYRRSQTSYTAPCNGVVSHGAQIGDLRVFTDHTRKNKRKTNVSKIFARRAAFYTRFYLHAQTAVDAGDAPDESRLFRLREKPEDPQFEHKPEDPQFEPHAGRKMVQVLGSPVYFYGARLLVHVTLLSLKIRNMSLVWK